MPPDTLLVREVLADRPDAVRTLISRLKCIPRILYSLNLRLGSPFDEHELSDLTQEVSVVIWKKLPTFVGKTSLQRWAFRISSHCMMNAVRRASLRQNVALGFEEDTGKPREDVDPFEYEVLHACVAELPEALADVLRLKHFEELTFEQIGVQKNLPRNTIKTRYYRARRTLLEALIRRGELSV